MSILCHFPTFGAIAEFGPLGSALEVHGSPPPINGYMCMPTEFKDTERNYVELLI